MKNILIGVTGSVAAIKTIELATQLSDFANIKIVTTKYGYYFIEPELKFFEENSIEILHDKDEWPELSANYDISKPILHIEMRRWADLLLLAPLDANSLAKISHGFCDNLLTSIVRAWDWQKPLIACPAMNTFMWENKPTQQHIDTIKQWGAHIINPIKKKLACNDIGMGAMEEITNITKIVKSTL